MGMDSTVMKGDPAISSQWHLRLQPQIMIAGPSKHLGNGAEPLVAPRLHMNIDDCCQIMILEARHIDHQTR